MKANILVALIVGAILALDLWASLPK